MCVYIFIQSNLILSLCSIIYEFMISLIDEPDVLLQTMDLLLALLHLLFLHLVATHDILDLLHRVLHIQRHTNCKRHLIGIIDAHAEKSLHGLELALILNCNGSAALFIDKLNDSAWKVLALAVHRPNQEVPHLRGRRLIVDFVLELSLLRRVIRDEDLTRLKHHA